MQINFIFHIAQQPLGTLMFSLMCARERERDLLTSKLQLNAYLITLDISKHANKIHYLST